MPTAHIEWPLVDVIVAVRNEAQMIAGKLRELDAIDYPAERLRFVLVDGGSTDGTLATIAAHAARDPRCIVLATSLASKPAQLNEALARTRAPWVLVTDADARVPAGTLQRLLGAARHDRDIGVVGTTVVPHQPHPLEAWHWRISNWARHLERRARGATGLAVGTCYLFRRDLFDRFPDDAIADDVHVVCEAARRGARTALADGSVTELRVATTVASWFQHKVRRTLAYLREVFRFGPAMLRMQGPMRTVLLWRALALTAGPAAGLAATGLLVWLIGFPWVAGVALILALAAGIPSHRSGLANPVQGITMPFWLLLVTLTALLIYPFVRQSGSYSRRALRAGSSEACS